MNSPLAAPLQGPVALSVPFSPRSAGEVRRSLVSWLAHQGASESASEDARLVVTELVANAVRHAAPLNNGTILVRWRREDGMLLISVCDGGSDHDPALAVVGPDSERGRGLAIVDALSVRWWVERTRRVHVIHVKLPLN